MPGNRPPRTFRDLTLVMPLERELVRTWIERQLNPVPFAGHEGLLRLKRDVPRERR